jgi:hypothetical protein
MPKGLERRREDLPIGAGTDETDDALSGTHAAAGAKESVQQPVVPQDENERFLRERQESVRVVYPIAHRESEDAREPCDRASDATVATELRRVAVVLRRRLGHASLTFSKLDRGLDSMHGSSTRQCSTRGRRAAIGSECSGSPFAVRRGLLSASSRCAMLTAHADSVLPVGGVSRSERGVRFMHRRETSIARPSIACDRIQPCHENELCGIRRVAVIGFTFVLLVAPESIEASETWLDIPVPVERATHFVPDEPLAADERCVVRIDRDGNAMVLAGERLLQARDGRLVPYRALRGVAASRQRDLGLLDGHFVFLDDRKLLPLEGAGRGFLDTRKLDARRVAPRSVREHVLLSPSEILVARDGEVTSIANTDYTDLASPDAEGNVLLWARDRLAVIAGDRIRALPPASAPVRDAAPLGVGIWALATDRGLARVTVDGEQIVDPRPLPVADLRAIAVTTAGDHWLGSTRGAFKLHGDGRVHYYAGRRWLLDDDVRDIVVDTGGDVWVLTSTGLSKFDFEPMTLADKAAWYLEGLRARHVRFGLVSDVRFASPGDRSSAELVDTDNDGLWSSIYLAAESYRHRVTGAPDALENVLDGLDALERLLELSSIPGFQARTFELDGFQVSDVERWRERPGRDFAWKGHTSSDEIVGTFFFYSVLWRTVAHDRPELRDRIARAVGSILDHILDHDLYLVDVDGKPTLWGRWNPEYVNTTRIDGDRRLNSIEILAFLELGWETTRRERYRRTFYDLVEAHGYAENTVRWLPDPLGPWNHSDDELYWLSYDVLLAHTFDPELREVFLRSAREHHRAMSRKQNPLWTLLYGSMTGDPIDTMSVARALADHPLDLRDWRMTNSHRLDVRILRRPRVAPETAEPLPARERRVHKWNSNELIPDGGGDGTHEESGAEWLLPYWLGRSAGYISPPRLAAERK